MMQNGMRRKRRQLSPAEKWQVFLEVTTGQLSQSDCARKWGVDVSVVIRIRKLAKDAALAAFASAKPGRLPSSEQVELEEALRENEVLARTVKEQAIELALLRGSQRLSFSARSQRGVSAEAKLELLGLIDRAVADGWTHARACRVLELVDERAHRWRARLRETGSLEDGRPGGGAVHGLLEWEEQAILELIETWGPVDLSHRKLAHRGSYIGQVFVSPSTVLRVAAKHRVRLPGEPHHPRPVLPAMPQIAVTVQSWAP